MWNKIKNKLKSPVVWAAAIALLTFVLNTWCGVEIPGWDEFVGLLMAALVAFGIVNNPDNHKEF